MPNCLVGCIEKYSCMPVHIPGFDIPDWTVASPYVRVKFNSSGNEITVGNESAPCCGSKMIVKSFEYGHSDGFTMKVEIHDEEGGAFQDFVDNIIKCGGKFSDPETQMEAEWGWIVTTCDGTRFLHKTPQMLPALVIDLDVSFSDGKARYNIEGKPVGETILSFREDDSFGEDGIPIHLTDAIEQLCEIPPAMSVEFVRINESGKRERLEWAVGDPIKGPKSSWPGDSMNKLSTISKWIEPFVTKNNKGICIVCDNRVANKILLLEDVASAPGESGFCKENLGTFIVNGGPCSNVIEFNPSFNWLVGLNMIASGGGTGSAIDGGRVQHEDERPDPAKQHGPNAGVNVFATPTRQAADVHGNKNATKETAKGNSAHNQAAIAAGQQSSTPISGELRIIGDPRPQFVFLDESFGRELAIVMINPFHIDGNRNGGCGDWLARPGCNNVLSNKRWRATGCHHSIKDGFYETTIKVQLDVPSVELDSGAPLGGPGSLGYTPAHTC